MSARLPAGSALQNKKLTTTSWVLQVLAAAAFLAAGGAKIAGVPMMVAIFDQIGIGQWFRVVTGVVEIIGGIAILIPATAAFGGVLLAITMICGVLTHFFVIGGNPGPAILLLVITGTVAYLRRASIFTPLDRA